MRKHVRSIPEYAMQALVEHPWRGNVRELANFIERAVILTRGDELDVPIAELCTRCEVGVAPTSPLTFRQAESSAIVKALRAASGQIGGKGGAAERLGLRRTTLQNKMRRLNISRADFSPSA